MRFTNRVNSIPQQAAPPAMPYYTCGSFNGTPPFGMQGAFQSQQPALPSGYPSGGTTAALVPSQGGGAPAIPFSEQVPATVQSTLYTPGFLRTQIGKRMRVEFLIGTGALVDRTGTLINVGASYILLRLIDSDDVMMCDIYSIKFATIFY